MYSNFIYGDVHHGIYGWKMCLMATHKLILNLGLTVFKLLYGEVYHGIYGQKMCLMATHKLILNLGITVFKLFIMGGTCISWDIWSENVFDSDAQTDT